MKRAIIGYHQDDEGHWVAELSCGHNQHMRHMPPFILRYWVTREDGRRAKLGKKIPCPLCDEPKAAGSAGKS